MADGAAQRHVRMRILAPGEAYGDGDEIEDRYAQIAAPRGAGSQSTVCGSAPVNFNALRRAERHFKAKHRRVEELLADAAYPVVDLHGGCQTAPPAAWGAIRRRAIAPITGCTREGAPLSSYAFDDYPGFLLIPDALDEAQQKYWIERSISSYMCPPNATNLDAHYKVPPCGGLWGMYTALAGGSSSPPPEDGLPIERIEHPDDSVRTRSLPPVQICRRADVVSLIRRIRWATLGYQYDWTTKTYPPAAEAPSFPADLAAWAEAIAGGACSSPSIQPAAPFVAQAGIVNFYQSSDSLTSHVDRSEENQQAPLVSLSLGASCIFLLGGPSRDDPVMPVLLQSGDVLIMAGESRKFFHGVPRILPAPHALAALPTDAAATREALHVLGDARININIRQVF